MSAYTAPRAPWWRNTWRLIWVTARRPGWHWFRGPLLATAIGLVVGWPLDALRFPPPLLLPAGVLLAFGSYMLLGYLRLRALRVGLRRSRLPICRVCGFPGEGPCDIEPTERDVESADARRGRRG